MRFLIPLRSLAPVCGLSTKRRIATDFLKLALTYNALRGGNSAPPQWGGALPRIFERKTPIYFLIFLRERGEGSPRAALGGAIARANAAAFPFIFASKHYILLYQREKKPQNAYA